MINQYCDNTDVATVFLKSLTNKNTTKILKSKWAEQGGPSIQCFSFHASMFGYMAIKFRHNFIDKKSDKSPSVANTVRRVISYMKETFFDQSHDQIRNSVALSMYEILESCFEHKRYGINMDKKAKDLIFGPLFEELEKPKNRVTR